MDEKRGKSLRKKSGRTQKNINPKKIGAPVPIANTKGLPSHIKPSAELSKYSTPRERPQQGDRTADLVKRRYSTRFAQLPQDFNAGAPPVPSLPLPDQYGSAPPSRDGPVRQESSERRRLKLDPNVLSDPNFTPERGENYVSSLLADATEEEYRDIKKELLELKKRSETDLRRGVFQERHRYIRVGKEAEKLKSEMKTLQGLMSELTETIGRANAAAGITPNASFSQKRANRSSVANLEAMWNSHLHALWKRVEGSQKFLPATPGRHIVYESGRWVELNVATWKAKRRVHIILLNDHLLVAIEKKNAEAASQNPRDAGALSNNAHAQHVAYRCWPLQDVQLIDLAGDSVNTKTYTRDDKLKNSSTITVRTVSESFTFAAVGSDTAEKEALLVTYRRAVEELRRAAEADHSRRGTSRRSGAGLPIREKASTSLINGLEISTDQEDLKSYMFLDGDGKQQNLWWVEGQFDSLDIHTALQQFKEAVGVIGKLKGVARNIKNNPSALDYVNRELDTRAATLASSIVKQLVETHSQRTATKENVGWLLQLEFDERARSEYLGARSASIKKKTRQCMFDGNLESYIYQISFIYFTSIRNTIDIYQSSFPIVMTSVVVKWAKEQVDIFNEQLERQMSGTDRDSQLWRECMETTFKHASMLTEVGLNFNNMIGRFYANESIEKNKII